MSEIFISYARPTERQARQIGDALRGLGYSVWRDDELPAHRAYSDVIEERIKSAKAVLVLWSADAAKSQWVRAEADAAREAGTLVQATVDGIIPPMPFNQIQCADLSNWAGDTTSQGWHKVESSIALLAGTAGSASRGDPSAGASGPATRKLSVCVLPFVNMSGDAEQEYFSDGISEDIITDLSKISALSVIARNTAFTFKGKVLDVKDVARQLAVSHVLEGSVRKAGARVRITAQLIDGKAGDHLWAERYDRDLTDIFAIQDEISKAIASALQLKLLPKEKKAIEDRGTDSAEAYNLYLMARQHWISGNDGDPRRDQVVERICRQATGLDPNYARAWALMALAQAQLEFRHSKIDKEGLASAERALALDPTLAEAHCVKATYLRENGEQQHANVEIELALKLNPESWEVNKEAGRHVFRQGRIADAVPYFEKAAALMDSDYNDTGLLISCYNALGDDAGRLRAARMTQERAEKAIAHDPSNGAALGYGASSLAVLGDADRAKEWIQRALLIDPENLTMRYNLACSLSTYLDDSDGALELLEVYFAKAAGGELSHAKVDPDMDRLREHPRFKEMTAAADIRTGAVVTKPALASPE
ncbi:MAG: TIR domain-containing protein [Sphingomicrobium sp.]